MFCPLCGTILSLANDGIYFTCYECGYSEETMPLEEETYIL